jgi:integrin beta 2
LLLAENLTKCGSNEFYCPEPSEGAPFSCLPISWRCDGGIDCQHNGQVYDEVNCPPVNCSSDEFNCGHSCIDADWQCDTEDDCAFGEDEANCTTPSPDTCDDDEFYCSLENECIPRDWHCDGESDCVGDEDEKNCPGLLMCVHLHVSFRL